MESVIGRERQQPGDRREVSRTWSTLCLEERKGNERVYRSAGWCWQAGGDAGFRREGGGITSVCIRGGCMLVGHRHVSHVVMRRGDAVGVLMSTFTDVCDCLSRDEDRVRAINRGALYRDRTQPEQHQQD